MARFNLDLTTPQPNGQYGESFASAFGKINQMTTELYGWNADERIKALTATVDTSVAKLQGGNGFSGSQAIMGGYLLVKPVIGGDQIFMRLEGMAGVTIDAVNSDNSAYRPLTLRGSTVVVASPMNVQSSLDVATSIRIGTQNIGTSGQYLILHASAGSGAGSVNLRPRGAFDSTGEMYVSPNGSVTAVSFNPTSSADVKDYIEGYKGDADQELDRLVVISYRYRNEFLDSGTKTFLGLLAENVKSVVPAAVGGDTEEVRRVPVDGVVDDDGNQVFREEVKHTPMNVDMMQILALNTRAHQQKSRRIRQLEAEIETMREQIATILARFED